MKNITTYKSARIVISTVRDDPFSYPLDAPSRIESFWREVIEKQADHESEKESLCVAIVDTRFNCYAWNRISLGTINECSAHPREIMRPIITANAYGFAIMHNHPSGDPSPSRADEQVTMRLQECADLFQIRMLDHVVIGSATRAAAGLPTMYSFREAGLVH